MTAVFVGLDGSTAERQIGGEFLDAEVVVFQFYDGVVRTYKYSPTSQFSLTPRFVEVKCAVVRL